MDASTPFADDLRLSRQITFLAELDKLKDILRRSLVTGSRRRENSAEHSWHLALMTLVLMEHAPLPGIDQLRVLKMVLVHDIVEIDADDTFCYDASANATKLQREEAAASRIFSLLPSDQAALFRGIWDEFEAAQTPEARIAHGLDRLHPILQNLLTGGASWKKHGVTRQQVVERNRAIAESLPEIWTALERQLDRAEANGFFSPVG